MKRITWLTDIHLNFVSFEQIKAFLESVLDSGPDLVVISGDIGEAHTVSAYLRMLAVGLRKPIYYVLGNHDFYFGSIEKVRAGMEQLSQESPWLSWLPQAGLVEVTPDTALVGHDGWADGRFGDYQRSGMMLNDYVLIAELAGLGKPARLAKMNALGDEAADHLRQVLVPALRRYSRVFVVTHVPPFKEACWHDGAISDSYSLPHFACKAVGDVLYKAARTCPEREITVLCGHTHGEGEARILPNLLVLTGGAEYGAPIVQQVFEV